MATEKEIRLVEQLLDKTRKRILSWEPTAREDELLSTLGGTVLFTLSGGGRSRATSSSLRETNETACFSLSTPTRCVKCRNFMQRLVDRP